MQTVYEAVAGLDVHKQTVVACVRRRLGDGRIDKEVRTFATKTSDLQDLSKWLCGVGVTHVAMESTGVFWKPVYNILEEADSLELLLVNARHIKQVPGRKTDVRDCEWIAEVLQCGLLRGSFIPARRQREYRELTRQRKKLVQDRNRVVNRIQAVLEEANVKLSSVATDILGVSGRAMLEAIVAGTSDAQELACPARGKLISKRQELASALEGRVTDHHRFMLRLLLDQIGSLEGAIERISERLGRIADDSFRSAVRLAMTIPGVGERTAEALIAEIGTDMDQFGTAAQLASWAGMCPGNNESAGKRKSGRTNKANRWLRTALSEAAWAAARSKGTYLQVRYRRLAARRGSKRAIVAVGHTILVSLFHMLREGAVYCDLGPDQHDRRNAQRLTRHHVERLRQLGYEVRLDPLATAA